MPSAMPSTRLSKLSRPEVYGTWDNVELKDGERLEYYLGLTDAERIKYDLSGSARNSWLRSLSPNYSYIVRTVTASGTLDSNVTNGALSVAPTCIIA